MLRTLSLAGWREGLAAAHGWRAAWAWAVVVVAALRLGLGLLMGLAWAVARPYMPPAVFHQLQLVVRPGYGPAFTRALEAWPRWDAMHYFALAQHGYFGVSEGDTVFYPLYPALQRALAPVLGGDYLLASLLVSTVATAAALACLYMLAESRYGRDAARWAVLALALYPTAFFLFAPFTESLFLALTLGAFLAADARRLAGVVLGLHHADDGERVRLAVGGRRGIEPGDADQIGAQEVRQLLDVAGRDLGGVDVRFGRVDRPLGRAPDDVGQGVGEVAGRRVDEEVPVGIVAASRPRPGKGQGAQSQRH